MLIGRNKERNELLALLDKDESQFCAVYGRRRVGKTYLIKETFENHFAFYHTGVANADKKEQLTEFRESLRKAGLKRCKMPRTWFEAFHLLETVLDQSTDKKKVVFLDELPWMDTQKSQLISALEHFWNGWANMRNDIVLVVCGSATSWIINNIMRNHGGLHNRLTDRIYVPPFTLGECEEMAQWLKLSMSQKDIAEAYMILGGIPYYWSLLRRNESLAQNIDRLFFEPNGRLANEFNALYASLFKHPAPYIAIVTALATQKTGMSRKHLLKATGLNDNRLFTQALEELEHCDFIRKYQAIGKMKREGIYQLMDCLTLFHFQYLANNRTHDNHFWSNNLPTPLHTAWAGLAFERLCLWHLPQIRAALGFAGIINCVQSWHTEATDDHEGAQIDLLFDRSDGVINLCEMKFSNDTYRITKDEDRKLRRRKAVFEEVTQTRKAIHITMITTYGVAHTPYWNDIQSEVTLNDLFKII